MNGLLHKHIYLTEIKKKNTLFGQLSRKLKFQNNFANMKITVHIALTSHGSLCLTFLYKKKK